MGPILGRIAFQLGILVFVLALIPLPMVPRGSAEFVVDVIALVLSGTFLLLLTWHIRRSVRLSTHDSPEQADLGRIEYEDQ